MVEFILVYLSAFLIEQVNIFLPPLADAVSVRHPPHHRNHVHKQSEKTTRVRTVLNEKQLHTLRTCYNANPRPDALMKEQLVEMTGLSPRVIRVWFQNKRCKDKKRSILMKQIQQQQHSDKTVSLLSCSQAACMVKTMHYYRCLPRHTFNTPRGY